MHFKLFFAYAKSPLAVIVVQNQGMYSTHKLKDYLLGSQWFPISYKES